MKTIVTNIFRYNELDNKGKQLALARNRHYQTAYWSKATFHDDFCTLSAYWEDKTGIAIYEDSIKYRIDNTIKAGVWFRTYNNTGIDITHALLYYSKQGEENEKQVLYILKDENYPNLLIDYDFKIFNAERKVEYKCKNNHEEYNTNGTKELAETVQALLNEVVGMIADYIFEKLSDIKEQQESDSYLEDLFNTCDIWFYSDGTLYNRTVEE